MSSSELLLKAQNLGKCYQLYEKPHHRLLQSLFRGKKQFYREFWALKNISLELHRGESLGIIGRNGAGKSTLLQLLSRVLTPTTGTLEVHGRVAALLELGSGFNPEFTGRENAYLNGAILGLSKEEMDAAMPEIERFAGVGDFFDQPVKLYSSGMLVRVAFAVQVQIKPDILIVDEALAVGDIIFQKRCFQRIREMLEQGTSLIFVSHDTEGVRTFTQKAILLHQGLAVAAGDSPSVLNEYQQMILEEEKNYLEQYIAEQTTLIASYDGQRSSCDDNVETLTRGDNEFGTFEAVITKVEILDALGHDTNLILSGDPLRIRVSFTVHADLDTLIASVRIRNREGVKCYSWGTLTQDVRQKSSGGQTSFWGKPFKAGTTCQVEFVTESCVLGSGFYEVEALLTKRATLSFLESETAVHWLHETAFFSVRLNTKENFFGGVCDLRMKAVLLKKDESLNNNPKLLNISSKTSKPDKTMAEDIAQYITLYKEKPNYWRDVVPEYFQQACLFIDYLQPSSILDYGCGTGALIDAIQKKYPNILCYKYDPAITGIDFLPVEKVDMIINMDVLEHIQEENVEIVIKKISKISQHVFFGLHHALASTVLPNGKNAHCTIKPREWYYNLAKKYFSTLTALDGHEVYLSTIITFNITEYIKKRYTHIINKKYEN